MTHHLLQEIKDLLHKPRLVMQYIVLNFFLISVGVAAVVYSKKEILVEQTRVQSEQILSTTDKLDDIHLPRSVEKSVTDLKEGAQKTLEATKSNTTLPKENGSSQK